MEPEKKPEGESRFISYQTNKIPWWIHAMWISFALAGTLYLIIYALPDFIRWWQ